MPKRSIPPPEPPTGPSRISPDDALPDVLERVVQRRQLRVEISDVLVVREREPRLNPYANASLQWRFRVRVASEPGGTTYTSFQHAASAAKQLADDRRARVIYLEGEVPTLLADHRR